MPVMREWCCNHCGHEFERIRPVCPICLEDGARRVFLTPPRISGGVAKRTDAILEHQFKKLGITNFSNSQKGSPNKISWAPLKTASYDSGGQPEILPATGLGSLASLGFNPASLTKTVDAGDGVQIMPYAVPKDVGAGMPLGVPIGGRPEALYKATNLIGKLDSDGRSIQRVG